MNGNASDFGATPMGHGQVVARAQVSGERYEQGGPGEHDSLPVHGLFRREPLGALHEGGASLARECLCVPALAELDIHDVRCPAHGLEAFLRDAIGAGRP